MTTAYNIIKDFYADKKASRSQVPLINHIDEGLKILTHLKASQEVLDAYCLHPILQSDEALLQNMDFDFKDISHKTIILAMEYRRVANSFLSRNIDLDFVGLSCEEVRQMLIADKVQNYKDFIIHHYGKHGRSHELNKYFNDWFKILDIDYYEYEKILGRQED